MGFFSDLKEDLSQAVNELMPGDDTEKVVTDEVEETEGTVEYEAVTEAEEVEEVTAEETTETADENADEDMVSLDEMLKNIDSIQLPMEDEEVEDAEASEEVAEDAPAVEEESIAEEEDTLDVAAVMESAIAIAESELAKEENEEISEEIIKDKGEDKMDTLGSREVADETAVITAGMIITGDLESEGSADIIGTINGNIEVLGKLNITGHVNGNSRAAEIYADGAKINGEIVSDGAVKIGASTVIIGNISATSAAIAGAVKGDIDVQGPVILDASAIVMGNIKSKSVQINNGAVIEGMCSQCYADVSPTSFFDDYKPESKKAKNK